MTKKKEQIDHSVSYPLATKMLVLVTVVDRQVVVAGVCRPNKRGLAEEWQKVDEHRQIHEVDILT